jgi:hypothetical protein
MEIRNTNGVISLPATSFGNFNGENRSPSANVAYDGEGRLVHADGLSLAYSVEGHVETIYGPDRRIERQILYDGEGNLACLVGDGEAHYYLRAEAGISCVDRRLTSSGASGRLAARFQDKSSARARPIRVRTTVFRHRAAHRHHVILCHCRCGPCSCWWQRES